MMDENGVSGARYLSVPEAARYMGLSTSQVHRLANAGRLRWIDVGTSRRPTKRIDRLSIDALATPHRHDPVKHQEKGSRRHGPRRRTVIIYSPV